MESEVTMTAEQAYPGTTYEDRLAVHYHAGDLVTIGPRYVHPNTYESDSACGPGLVIKTLETTADDITYLVRNTKNGCEYYLYSSRFTKR